jgi:hypothetical protein
MALSGNIVVDIVVGVTAMTSGIYLGCKKVKEYRAEKKGLLPNPQRCERHEERLGGLEAKCERFDERILNIQGDIAEIKGDVKTLLRRK